MNAPRRFATASANPLACLAFALLAPGLGALEWPQFRGPAGDGTVPPEAAANAPAEWSRTRNLLWTAPLPGPGSSSPVVAGGKVFLTCYSGYGLDAEDAGEVEALRRHALCLDLATGEVLWSHEVKPAGPQTPYEGRYITTHGYASSSAATDGAGVYFFLGDSGVFAFTLDGRLVWEGSVGTGSHEWGSGASPVLVDDLLVVNGASESDAVVAFDKKTGREAWRYEGVPRAWNTPVPVSRPGGGTDLLLATRGWVLGIDARDGSESFRARGINAAELCPSFVVDDGVAYLLGAPRGQSLALRLGGEGELPESDILWRAEAGSNVGSPVLHEGHLYFSNDRRGDLYCLRADTGEVVYEERLPGRGDRIYASPVLVGERLYYLGGSGTTYIVPAEPRFEILAANPLGEEGEIFNGSPALAGGKLLIRSDRALYCVGR